MEYEAKLHERTQDAGLFQVSGINWHEVNAKATGRAVLYIEERDKISDDYCSPCGATMKRTPECHWMRSKRGLNTSTCYTLI